MKKKFEVVVTAVEIVLIAAFIFVGGVSAYGIGLAFCPIIKEAFLAGLVCCGINYALGALAMLIGFAMKTRNTTEFFKNLAEIIVLVVIGASIAFSTGLGDESPFWGAMLPLQMVVGVVLVIVLICCVDAANYVRAKLFGNMVKSNGVRNETHEFRT